MPDERSPLIQFPGQFGGIQDKSGDEYSQFCELVGVKPMYMPPDAKWKSDPQSLWARATSQKKTQGRVYLLAATLTNTMLLSQVVLGAALTALGASNSSHILITVFGALNTIIAGLIAWFKSRGQPMRARMFRDDLDRVVDEIENSAVMWLGISRNAHGYDAIDTDDLVTVRSEVARLTRLYDRAVKDSTRNDPDMYASGQPGDPHSAALRTRAGTVVQPANPAAGPAPIAPAPLPATLPISLDPDDSPATKPPSPTPPPATPAIEATKDVPEKDMKSASDGAAPDDKSAKKDESATNAPDTTPVPSSSSSTAPATMTSAAPVSVSAPTSTPNTAPAPVPASEASAPQPAIEEDEDESPAVARNGSKTVAKKSKSEDKPSTALNGHDTSKDNMDHTGSAPVTGGSK